MATLALILAFSFGNLYKFSLFSPEVRISVLDCTIFILTIISLPKTIKKLSRIAIPILAFFLVGTVAILFAIPQFGVRQTYFGSFYLFRWLFYSTFFLTLNKSKNLILNLGTITTVLGLLQYIFFPDIRSLAIAEWDPHYYRVVGTLLDPGYVGIVLVLFMTYLLSTPKKMYTKVLLILTYIIFALTYSRSSYLAYLVSMAYIAFKIKGWQFFLKVLFIFILTILLLPRASGGEGVKLERESSTFARIKNWRQSFIVFSQNPVLGVGFNTYRYAQRQSGFLDDSKWLKSHAGAGADSSLLFVAATTGLIGLSFYFYYLKSLWQLNSMRYTLIPLLVHSLFLNSLFYPAIMLWVSVLIRENISPKSLSA